MEFTTEEMYEMNDALMEVIDRMLHDGQTRQEVEYGSLKVMWGLRQRFAVAVLGSEQIGDAGLEEKVVAAIREPKILNREHAYY